MTGRPGFALVLSLLLTLALMVLALGVLAVGTRERAVAAALVRKARAQRLAEAEAAAALRQWSSRAWAELETGEARPLATSPTGRVTVVRVDRALYLVRADVRVPGPWEDVVGGAAVLVRTLPPVEEALAGTITAERHVTVDGGSVGPGPGSGASTGCSTGGPAPGIVAPSVAVAPRAVVTGSPPVALRAPPPRPAPDALAPSIAARIAQIRPAGRTATPRPLAAAGECIADRKNWGSPELGHPCHGLRPVVFAVGPFTVAGGEARAVLVVDGDLRVTGGAVLDGVVVVHGELRIEDGSVIRGAVRARSVHVTDGTVVGDRCAVGALSGAPALDRAYRPPLRWWVPTF